MVKQKVVMKLNVEDAKKKSKALKTAVGVPGVLSASLEGEKRDKIVVVGDGTDAIHLTTMLRKKVGNVELISVTPVDEKKIQGGITTNMLKKIEDDDKSTILQPPVAWPYQSTTLPSEKIVQQPVSWPSYNSYQAAAIPPPQHETIHEDNNDPCCIM